MRFPRKPTSKDLPALSASEVTGYWYWLLHDGTLIGGSDRNPEGLLNHYDIMCRLLKLNPKSPDVISKVYPLYKSGEMYKRYGALRISISPTHQEINVQVYGRITAAQVEALRTLFNRNKQRITWDLGLEARLYSSGEGSFTEFLTGVDKCFGRPV